MTSFYQIWKFKCIGTHISVVKWFQKQFKKSSFWYKFIRRKCCLCGLRENLRFWVTSIYFISFFLVVELINPWFININFQNAHREIGNEKNTEKLPIKCFVLEEKNTGDCQWLPISTINFAIIYAWILFLKSTASKEDYIFRHWSKFQTNRFNTSTHVSVSVWGGILSKRQKVH